MIIDVKVPVAEAYPKAALEIEEKSRRSRSADEI